MVPEHDNNIATWNPLYETDLRMPEHRRRFWSNGVEVKEDWQGSS